MPCMEIVPGCADCESAPRATTEHTCDDFCEYTGERKRESDTFHRLMHEPRRHECGAVLDDRRGNSYEVRAVCGYGCCVQLFCPRCRRDVGGWGPVNCPSAGRNGHGTRAEFKRPGAGRWVKALKRKAHR